MASRNDKEGILVSLKNISANSSSWPEVNDSLRESRAVPVMLTFMRRWDVGSAVL
jgi:hypothetical protein